MKRRLLMLVAMLCSALLVHAQEATLDDKAANFLRESDKLYVVITVLITIFVAIVIFLTLQERKISRLEKKLKDKEQT